MKVVRVFVLGCVLATLMACGGFRSMLVHKASPPYHGTVELRMAPATSKGVLIFQFDWQNSSTATPQQSEVDQMKAKCQELGANALVLECGALGTVGQAWCQGRGYKE